MALTIPPALGGLLKSALAGAITGAGMNLEEFAREAQAGSMKLMVIFKTPDGKLQHIRILMTEEEAALACKATHREIREAQKAKR